VGGVGQGERGSPPTQHHINIQIRTDEALDDLYAHAHNTNGSGHGSYIDCVLAEFCTTVLVSGNIQLDTENSTLETGVHNVSASLTNTSAYEHGDVDKTIRIL
jgi:hypothetical protein